MNVESDGSLNSWFVLVCDSRTRLSKIVDRKKRGRMVEEMTTNGAATTDTHFRTHWWEHKHKQRGETVSVAVPGEMGGKSGKHNVQEV